MFTTNLSNPCATFKFLLGFFESPPFWQFLPPKKQAAANSVRPGVRNCRVVITTYLLNLQAHAYQISIIFQH